MRLTTCRLLVVVIALSCAARAQEPFRNSALSPEVRAHDLVSRLTLEEKAEQTLNSAPAVPRLGIPAYDYWNEGLHGIARSGYSTLFPQAIGMAATWDAPLLHGMGDTVSTEARAKYNDAVAHGNHSIYFGLTIWSPNINIFRDPRWGRGQETYGEDPFLTSQLGLNFVRGLQGPDPLHPRVIATPKHYAVHSGPERDRHRFNVDPTPHDLWDTYLPQFRAAIVDGQAGSIMCAYNAVDGKPACGSDLLLEQILRGDWHFHGFVTSDCGAIDDFVQKSAHAYSPDDAHASATAVLTGTDTNCGDTYRALPQAVHAGLLREADLDRAVERLFTARFRLGMFDPPASTLYGQLPYSEVRSPQHLALSLRASRESMVLLKNDSILPLVPGKYRTIAVVGPNAASLAALEGNYNAVPKDPQMPVDSIAEAFPGAHIVYAQGAPYVEGAPLPVPRTVFHPDASSSENGLRAEYFRGVPGDATQSFQGKPVATRIDKQIDFDWNSASPIPPVDQSAFAVRWSGTLTPPQAGDQIFEVRLAHCYPCHAIDTVTVKIDGKIVSTFATTDTFSRPGLAPAFHVSFANIEPHTFELDYTHSAPLFGGGLTLEWVPSAAVLQSEAVRAAQGADLVIAMLGLSPELEGEEMRIEVPGFLGGDRTDMELPASQAALMKTLAGTGKPVIGVLLNGSALAMHDLASAHALLEAWYPGEFGGRAIAETLTGVNNPAGRLPVTFYASTQQLPPFDDYSMAHRTYRYFTGAPSYAFGYGLSYTKFAYAHLKLGKSKLRAGDTLTAEADVKNVGTRAGDEVAELFLIPPASGNAGLSPHLQMAGFQRVTLQPGESQHVAFTLTPRELSEVDGGGNRAVQPGTYRLAIGGAQPTDPKAPTSALQGEFRIVGTVPLPR